MVNHYLIGQWLKHNKTGELVKVLMIRHSNMFRRGCIIATLQTTTGYTVEVIFHDPCQIEEFYSLNKTAQLLYGTKA